MKFIKKHDSNEDSFWLSATDMMAGILVVVLLLLMLFLLYLNNSADKVFTPLDETQHPGQGETQKFHNEFETFSYGETTPPISETQQQQEQQPRTEPPTEVRPGKDVEEGYDKAAVFVTIVDDDSGNIIEGVSFAPGQGLWIYGTSASQSVPSPTCPTMCVRTETHVRLRYSRLCSF